VALVVIDGTEQKKEKTVGDDEPSEINPVWPRGYLIYHQAEL